jgi:uncharacterized repeat protein (TIGR01451 family)
MVAATPVFAAGTAANTTINNTATVNYEDPPGTPHTANSNTVAVVVDEILNVTVADGGNVTVFTPDGDRALSFTITNTGNGTEAYELSFAGVAGDDFDPDNAANNPRIFLDDGDGVFDAGDTLYVFGVNEPVLAPDASRVVFFVSNIPSGRASGDSGSVSLRATAVSADPNGNAPGTTFAGAGDGGTDAVAGGTTASALDQASYTVSAVTTNLNKTATIADPFGGSNAVPGAIITYTLTFTLSGSGSITLGQISDPIPANSTYVPNSTKLNGVAQTDAADSPGVDNSRFTGTGVEVNLASPLAAPSTQTVQFQITIN